MASLTDAIPSSEHPCNDICTPGSLTTASGRCARPTSAVPNTQSTETNCDIVSSLLKEPRQTPQNIKGTSNHGSAVRKDEERPKFKVASGISHSPDTKSCAKTSGTAKYTYEQQPHIQAPSMVTTSHQLNTVDLSKGVALSSSLLPQPLGSQTTSASNSRTTSRYTPVPFDLANSGLVSSVVKPRSVTHSSHNLADKMATRSWELALAPPSHCTSSTPTAASILGSMGSAQTEGHHRGAVGGSRAPLSNPHLAKEGNHPLRSIPPQSNSNASDVGKAPPPPPESRFLTTRSNTATAVPLELTSVGAQPPKPPQRQRPTESLTLPEDIFREPTRALTVRLVSLYKYINARYWHGRRMEAPGPKYNNGYDDKDGHYIVLPGEEILNRFTVQEVLGKGSFGTVIRCYDEKRHEAVALKITRYGFNFREQAKIELDILLNLNGNRNLNQLVVKLLKVFDWQGHLVLVFELLSFNLYQLIKCTRYKGVCLDLVCKFAYQLVCALRQFELLRPQPIIHCDIKPENILLKNQNRSGIRLIDFGSACYANRRIHHYIQSRFYRSPEVIFYLDYSTAIDRWSLGCVLVELHTGVPLFDGRSEAEQLAHFEAVLGPLPVDMIARSSKASKYYNSNSQGMYELKGTPLPRRSLGSILGLTADGPQGRVRESSDYDETTCRTFLDFVLRLLRYRPEERISCADALHHPFFSSLISLKRG